MAKAELNDSSVNEKLHTTGSQVVSNTVEISGGILNKGLKLLLALYMIIILSHVMSQSM